MLNSKISIVAFSALFLIIALPALGQSRSNRMEIAQEKEYASLSTISALLKEHKVSAIMAYRCVCRDRVMVGLQFPLVKSNPDSDVLEALTKMLSSNHKFIVSKDTDGVIRIREGDVHQDVLNIRVHHVSFNERERVDPGAAMQKVIESPEVRSYFESRGIETPINDGGLVPPLGERVPRLLPEMNNVTVLDVMKVMLKTFPNLIVYRECVDGLGHRIVSIDFR
jgi:hypothetical protein